jgi:uncharacterized 2Fe-2S/4Fe-4S cluster protein (DUF4445 family)
LHQLRLLGHHLRADCGSDGRCGKCRVRFHSPPPTPDKSDLDWLSPAEIQEGWRLACRHPASVVVELESSPEWEVLFRIERPAPLPECHRLGLAIDIGTTGLVAALIDLDQGVPCSIARGYNPQRAYGADVMSRLVAARDPTVLQRLQADILEAIQIAMRRLFASLPPDTRLKRLPSLAVGNTVMIHLAAGHPETTLSIAPFRSPLEGEAIIPLPLIPPFSKGGAGGITPPLPKEVPGGVTLRLAGPLQSFIGSDLLAVLEFQDIHRSVSIPTLIMDLGTNSEIALWDGRRHWVTSCAAGPAFEGGGISCGAPAGPGVATGLQFDGIVWRLLPIGKKPMTALCGSALIALLARLVESGRLREDGKFVSGNVVSLQHSPHALNLTQKDVRSLQLAKAAIHAGIVVLARRAHLPLREIQQVIITGAFARDLKAADLKRIGLIPESAAKVVFVNDGALYGAAKALSDPGEPFADLRQLINVVNLVEEDDFQERFLEGLEMKPLLQ